MESMKRLDLKICCPPRFRIIDASMLKKIGIEVKDEPPINNLAVLKRFKQLTMYTSNGAGVAYLTVGEGLTLKQTTAIAAQGNEQEKMEVVYTPQNILNENGDHAVVKTYRILITEGFITGTEGQDNFTQNSIVSHFGSEMPTALEQTLLCVSTWKIFKECAFGASPRLDGRTSTTFKGFCNGMDDFPVSVGNCTRSFQSPFNNNEWVPAKLFVMNAYQNKQWCGAGGTNKLI